MTDFPGAKPVSYLDCFLDLTESLVTLPDTHLLELASELLFFLLPLLYDLSSLPIELS